MLEPADILFVGQGKTPVCWYRAALPAMHLGADWVGIYIGDDPRHPGLYVSTGLVKNNTQEPVFEDYRVVILQQPLGSMWFDRIKGLQARGIKVLYEVDDYLHGVHKAKGHDYARFYKKDVLPKFELCMRACDGLIASTEFIARRYKKFNPNTYVCRNGIDLARYALTIPERPTVSIGWAGATGHTIQMVNWLNGGLLDVIGGRDHVNFVAIGQPQLAQAVQQIHGESRAIGIPFTSIECYPSAMCLFDIALAPAGDSSWYRGKCLDAKTRVPTQRGIVSIAEVKVGDRVWTEDGWQGVMGTDRQKMGTGLRIRTALGYQLDLSPEHRMRTGDYWKAAASLREGDRLRLVPGGLGATKLQAVRVPLLHTGIRSDWEPAADAPSLPFIAIDVNWAELLGQFVGDGNINQKSVRFTTDAKDDDVRDRLVEILAAIGLRAIVLPKKTFDGHEVKCDVVKVSSTKLISVLAQLGLQAGNGVRRVAVPEVIWQSPRRVVAAFLRGLFEADGSVYGSTVELVTKDVGLGADIQRLLLAFGITCARRSFRGQGIYSERTYWRLVLRRRESELFAKQVGFASRRKRATLGAMMASAPGHRALEIPTEDEIVSISQVAIDPCDLQVEGEAFSAAGLLSHNSDLRWMEASALGLPCIASPNIYSDIEHGVTGFHASTPAEAAEIALALIDDEDLRRTVGATAKRHMELHRAMPLMALNWLEVARAVVGEYESVNAV